MTTIIVRESCRCNCGYTCGGRGTCKLPILECIRAGHHKKDCDHDFSKWQNFDNGGSLICTKCEMSAMGHDMVNGP